MNTFFICALPRSRTAWLANFLCYTSCHCFHEPFNKYAIDDLPGLFRSTGKENVGISDSLSTLFIGELLKVFPDSKLVLIRRSVHEVDHRLAQLGLPCPETLFRINAALDKIEAEHNPLVINYHNFDAPGIWNFLMPETPLNRERLEMLENFNVTVKMSVNIRKGQELVEKWFK